MEPIVYGLELKYGEQVNFIYFEISDPDTMPFKKELKLANIPHFFLLDEQGNILQQWVGPVPGEAIAQAIKKALN